MRVVALVSLIAMLSASVHAQSLMQMRPGLPNFNGQNLANALGQLIPDPASLVAGGSDDTDFLATPCSVDIHFGTQSEYICFCGETLVLQSDSFYCDRLQPGGELEESGTNGVLVGGTDNGGQVTGGVRVQFAETCRIKDVNVRLKVTTTNNSEIQAIFQVRQRDSFYGIIDVPQNSQTGRSLSIKLLAGQEKIDEEQTVDTCDDYRLAALDIGGTGAQDTAVLDVDVAYDDKIGLSCDVMEVFGGTGECTENLSLYSTQYNGGLGFDGNGVWQAGDISGVPDFCPHNKGQLNDELKYTDEYKDATRNALATVDLLATNTITSDPTPLQTGMPDAGTGQGLNVFDGFIILGGVDFNPCYELIETDTSGGAFFLTIIDQRESSKGGVTAHVNQWCADFLCEPEPPTPTPTPTTPAIVGDPHFTGFHGEKYDVMAEPGDVFNIITDTDVQLNALFIAGARGAQKTYVGEYGLKYRDHNVRVAASGQVFVNDVPLAHSNKEHKYALDQAGEAYIVSKMLRNGNVDVTVQLPDYMFKFGIISARNVMHEGAPGHVNLHLSVKNRSARPHGLLGQTVLPMGQRSGQRGHNDVKQGGDVIEGSYTQYKIADNSLFGDDFKFNRFGLPAKEKRDVDADVDNLTAFLG